MYNTWDVKSMDKFLTLGHTDQRGSNSRVEMTRDVSFEDGSSCHHIHLVAFSEEDMLPLLI
jgi:hypothetical protein